MIETKSLQQLAIDFFSSRTEKSFTLLHDRIRPGLRKYITNFHQESETIDEILAITLSKAFVYIDKYDSDLGNFSTWIYRICRNECLMEIRRKNPLSSLNSMMEEKLPIRALDEDDWKVEEEYEFFKKEETVQPDSLYEEVLEEIKKLPDHYKEIIEDRVVRKMKYKDIAKKRGLKINTVRSRIHSAKRVIRNVWVEKMIENGSANNVNIVGVGVLNLLDEKSSKKVSKKVQVEIISARYGNGDDWVDVTEKVKEIVNKRGEIKSSNRLGKDPCFGVPKKLVIKYIHEDEELIKSIREGSKFKF